MQLTTSQTKVCPFCAETILAAAIKCRHCGEFLNTARAKAMLNQPGQPFDSAQGEQGDGPFDSAQGREDASKEQPNAIVYSGGPTLWVIAWDFVKGAGVILAAILIIAWHIERISWLHLSFQSMAVVGKYRVLLGLGTIFVAGLILFYKALKIRMTHYEVSPDRIEYGEGVFEARLITSICFVWLISSSEGISSIAW